MLPTLTYESSWMTEDLRIFRRSARRFIENEFAPHQPRWRRRLRPDAAAWTKAGAAGLLLTG